MRRKRRAAPSGFAKLHCVIGFFAANRAPSRAAGLVVQAAALARVPGMPPTPFASGPCYWCKSPVPRRRTCSLRLPPRGARATLGVRRVLGQARLCASPRVSGGLLWRALGAAVASTAARTVSRACGLPVGLCRPLHFELGLRTAIPRAARTLRHPLARCSEACTAGHRRLGVRLRWQSLGRPQARAASVSGRTGARRLAPGPTAMKTWRCRSSAWGCGAPLAPSGTTASRRRACP